MQFTQVTLLLATFIAGVIGTVVGAVLAMFKVSEKFVTVNGQLALINQKITLLVEGPGGMLVRLANIEAAINARKVVADSAKSQ